MQLGRYVFASLLLIGCGSATSTTDPGPSGSGGTGGSGGGGPIGTVEQPSRLADDAVVIVGVTSDDQVIYRASDGLKAIDLDGGESAPRTITDAGGTVQIRGNIVFVYTQIDWETNLGELIVWTRDGGAKTIGTAMYGEETALASADGSFIAYMNNVSETSADLVVASPDLTVQKVVIPGVGRGSETTCRATYGFVSNRLIAAWCPPGKLQAKLERFDAPEFAPTTLATDVNTLWSSDQSGEKVFYTDPSSGGWYLENGKPVKIDAGVGWGTLLSDGSAVLYTVSDQLRRAEVPGMSPTPIVATKYTARAAWSPDYAFSLYSTEISYEHGTRRDLFITPTNVFNPTPVQLVEGPVAEVSRSAFTRDGKFVLYLVDTDIEAHEKALYVHDVAGGEPTVIEKADTALAAHGSRIVFSQNRSNPETYPITADLMVMDPASGAEPTLMTSATTDGRAFHVSSDGQKLTFVKPAGPDGGLYVQNVP